MFGTAVVLYMVAGGSAAMMLVVLCGFVLARRPLPGRRALGHAFICAFAVLAFAACCLAVDLGRPERFALVALHPTASAVSVGAFSLMASTALSLLLGASCLMLPQGAAQRGERVAAALGLVCGAVCTAYTGVLLVQVGASPLWNAGLVALFVASSASVGVAGVRANLALSCRGGSLRGPRRRGLVGAALLSVEVLCLAACLALGQAAQPGCVLTLLSRPESWVLWAGFGALGVAVPVALALATSARGRKPSALGCLLLLASLALGAYSLRYWLVCLV